MKPSVGRIVHYVSYGTSGGEFTSECRAAIVAAVTPENPEDDGPGERCDLVVFNPQGLFFNRVPYSEAPVGGTWHWPERVEG